MAAASIRFWSGAIFRCDDAVYSHFPISYGRGARWRPLRVLLRCSFKRTPGWLLRTMLASVALRTSSCSRHPRRSAPVGRIRARAPPARSGGGEQLYGLSAGEMLRLALAIGFGLRHLFRTIDSGALVTTNPPPNSRLGVPLTPSETSPELLRSPASPHPHGSRISANRIVLNAPGSSPLGELHDLGVGDNDKEITAMVAQGEISHRDLSPSCPYHGGQLVLALPLRVALFCLAISIHSRANSRRCSRSCGSSSQRDASRSHCLANSMHSCGDVIGLIPHDREPDAALLRRRALLGARSSMLHSPS